MLTLANVATLDRYDKTTTIEEDQAVTLTYIVANAPVIAQFRSARRESGGYGSYSNDVQITQEKNVVPNVSGAKFKSAIPGTPARVIAYLSTPDDPQIGAGVPFLQTLTATGTVGDVLTGAIFDFAGAVAPDGYLLCDGSAVSRTTYAALFQVIGSTFGAGDGSTTFNLPDLRGRIGVGLGTNPAVDTIGKNDGVAVANRRAQHRHTPHAHAEQVSIGGGGGLTAPGGVGPTSSGFVVVNAPTANADGGSGNGADALDAPAYLVLNKVIKT